MRSVGVVLAWLVVSTALGGCFGGKPQRSGVPDAFFTIQQNADDPQVFVFDATNSTDPDGDELSVVWSFGDDGPLAKGPMYDPDPEVGAGVIEYTYALTDGVFHVALVVEDPAGNRDTYERNVTVGTRKNTAPLIITGNSSRWVKPDVEITIDSSKSMDGEDDLFTTEWIVGNYTTPLPLEAVLSTPLMGFRSGVNQTFNTVGFYDYHCHPHPWMRGRIVVTDSKGPDVAVGSATVEIRAYTFQPKALIVEPGTVVRWVNEDPVPHNVTVDHFSPGKLQGEKTSSSVLAVKLPAGDYQANLILNDLKGGVSWQSLGLKVTADGPDKFNTTHFDKTDVSTGTAPVGLVPYQSSDSYRAAWPQNVTGSVEWTDPGGMSTWSIELYDATTGGKITGCQADGTSCSFVIDLVPGNYTVKLKGAGSGAQVDLVVTMSAIQYSKPPFGDASSTGHTHVH